LSQSYESKEFLKLVDKTVKQTLGESSTLNRCGTLRRPQELGVWRSSEAFFGERKREFLYKQIQNHQELSKANNIYLYGNIIFY